MLKLVVCVLSILNVRGDVDTGNASKIQAELNLLLEKGEKVNILISFTGGIKSSLERASALRHTGSRGERNTEILNILEENADSSQAGVVHLMSTRSSGDGKYFKYFKQYKSSNLIFVREATAEFVKLVAQDPQVAKIEKEPIYSLVVAPKKEKSADMQRGEDDNSRPTGPEWQLTITQVVEAWAELGDQRGDGVIVGAIDTGVRASHESLRENFVGNEYGWYDAIEQKPEPYDADQATGHGTSTMGVLAGNYGIGVVPNAKWMACCACNTNECKAEHLLDCIKFMECPTLPDGSNKNCSKAPHVVSNSWASIRGESGYDEFILRWQEMNIIPVFAIDNTGPGCDTSTSPGNAPFVIGVGASDDKDVHLHYSAVGPSPEGQIKPDLLGPGDFLKTAIFFDDDGYYWEQGTSIATPVVAGVVALLKVRDLDLKFQNVFDLLTQNTDQTCSLTPDAEGYCATQSNTSYPNNWFGYGRVNALKAIQAQTKLLESKNQK